MSVHRICVHHVSVHSYSPSLSFFRKSWRGGLNFTFLTFYFLLHAPLKQSAGVFLGLLDVETEHLRLYGREVYGAGLSLLDGIAVGICHGCHWPCAFWYSMFQDCGTLHPPQGWSSYQ